MSTTQYPAHEFTAWDRRFECLRDRCSDAWRMECRRVQWVGTQPQPHSKNKRFKTRASRSDSSLFDRPPWEQKQ